MDLIEKATIVHYHRHRIRTFAGGTPEALGWRERASQIRRFEVLAGVGDLTGRSVLDVGCGHADLKAFLDRRFTGFEYLGIDQMPEFVAEARDRYRGRADTTIVRADFTTAPLPRADYVLASGALGYRCQDPDFTPRMIRKMAEAARRAVAFNMLRREAFPEHPLLVGHDRDRVAAFCRELSPEVRVIEGYLEDDFTVFLYTGDRAGAPPRAERPAAPLHRRREGPGRRDPARRTGVGRTPSGKAGTSRRSRVQVGPVVRGRRAGSRSPRSRRTASARRTTGTSAFPKTTVTPQLAGESFPV